MRTNNWRNFSVPARESLANISVRLDSLRFADDKACETSRAAGRAMRKLVEAGESLSKGRHKREKRIAKLESKSDDANERARHARLKLAWEGRHVSSIGK